MPTRRAALLTIAGAAVSPLFSKQASEHAGHAMAEAASAAMSYEPVYFKQADYAVVSRLADLILPKTDTPGALDAHVPFRIDHEVAASPELQSKFETGLQLLQAEAKSAGASDFAALPEEKQVAILTTMGETADSPEGQFFHMVKGLTVDWYYRSEEGLVKELGFHGNTFRPDFPGCTHPEHWPSTAQETK
jgi:hypothetical protein